MTTSTQNLPRYGLAIHGGAGTLNRASMTPAQELAHHKSLRSALEIGFELLQAGSSSLDAVTETVRVLEDDPLFNAGRGAVFSGEGRNELDAAIMNGATLEAGAVASVTRIRNPVLLARLIMEKSPHVLLIGEGAEAFASSHDMSFVEKSWFHTDSRWRQLQQAQAAMKADHTSELPVEFMLGTVGAVALDRQGNLAAATSTGGMTNKRWGRIGDTPIIGAGTYADNASAAISATGHGEYFIRSVVAHEITARMRLLGQSLQQASHDVIMNLLSERGGVGGIVAIDRQGNVSMPFNSSGMYRGFRLNDAEVYTGIFQDSSE